MNILHFTAVGRNIYSGIYVAVPQHIRTQQITENVAVVNIYNIPLENVRNQFEYTKGFTINQIPQPFSIPDIVIFHGIYIPQYIAIYKELRKLEIPYIIVPHGSLTEIAQNKKKIKKIIGNTLVFNSFIKYSSAIQYLSESEATLSKYSHKSFISGNGIVNPKIKKNSFSKEGIKFVYIGRLEYHVKGLDLLVKAVAIKKDKMLENNCSFHIYGPDQNGQYAYLKNMINQYGLDKLIYLSSAVFGDEKEQILLDTDVFIQTSRTEGLPMGILEALSYGVPCLVTKGTGMGEVIMRYNAGWCAENNEESIANMMEEVIKGKSNQMDMGYGAIKIIEENYVWNRVVESALSNYKKIVDEQEEKICF